ncbi:MAG TPA: transglycosylase SLT domain-containing protein, partial [Xanthomonadales bacterium]|nr:transglycosylase SLT domain-containing protein [Xanthomonadales bacterium]
HGHGVFQIDDRWHAFARSPAAMDPGSNAEYAAGMLESNLHRFGGDVRAALSAYNSGSPTATGTLTDWGDGKAVSYADSVFRHYARLGGGPAAPAPGGGVAAPPTDPRDSADAVGALRALLAQLGPGGAAGAPDPSAALGLASPLSLPAYRPIPQADARERDIAPSAGTGDDTTD